MEYYAHTKAGPESTWEPLRRHLELVAHGEGDFPGAAGFAAAFGAREWGLAAGLLHDVGKYASAFQKYLRQTARLPDDDPQRKKLRGSVDHSTAGAVWADRHLAPFGEMLAYCLAGHHAGLPDTEAEAGRITCLRKRLTAPRDDRPGRPGLGGLHLGNVLLR